MCSILPVALHMDSYPGYQTFSKRKVSFRESLVPRVMDSVPHQ